MRAGVVFDIDNDGVLHIDHEVQPIAELHTLVGLRSPGRARVAILLGTGTHRIRGVPKRGVISFQNTRLHHLSHSLGTRRTSSSEESHDFSIDLFRVRPWYAVRTAFDLDELHILDHL